MLNRREDPAVRWARTARATLATARLLRDNEDHRSCVSRAYYAAYQAATSVCLRHGDAQRFPPGWNNPSHEQLPDLIANNGDLPVSARRYVKKALRQLRSLRETADYRIGATIRRTDVISALVMADAILRRLEVHDGDE